MSTRTSTHMNNLTNTSTVKKAHVAMTVDAVAVAAEAVVVTAAVAVAAAVVAAVAVVAVVVAHAGIPGLKRQVGRI